MDRTEYFLRGTSFSKIEKRLDNMYKIKTCYKTRKERILKNNDIIVKCKNKYIAVFLLDDTSKDKYKDIKAAFS